MALPRYNPSEVRLQSGASSVAFAEQARSWQTLSAQMDQFRNIAYGELASKREREAKEQAVIDVANGKMKNVGDYTIYDQVYKDTARTAFVTKTEQDVSTYADFTATQMQLDPKTKNNPDAFAQVFDSYVKGVLAEAPDEATRAVLKQSINKYGAAQYNTILKNKLDAKNKYEEKSFNDGVNLYKQEYKDAVIANDEAAMRIATQKLTSVFQSGIGSQYETEEGAKLQLKELKEEVFTEVSLQNFKDAPDRLEYLEKFRKENKLGVTKTDEIIAKMHQVMQSEFDDRKILKQKEDQEEEDFKEETKNSLNKKLLNGTLKIEDLDEALKFNGIERTDYDDFYKRLKTPGVTTDDDDTYSYYRKNLDSVTENMILNDENLTRESQKELISELDARRKEAKLNQKERDAEAEKLGKWESHSKGKEAIRRIKTEFQIFDGTIMSKVDLNNDITRDYGIIRNMFYDEVEALPLVERIPKSLSIANRLIKEYNEGSIVGTKRYKDALEEKEEAKKAAEKKQKTEDAEEIKGASNLKKFLDEVLPSW